MRRADIVNAIKERVSCRAFADFMGLRLDPKGFTVCPFHGDNDPSLKIYDGNRGWTCFGCHKGGDVINLAKEWYGLGFGETLAAIDRDFKLGLTDQSPEARVQRDRWAAEHMRKDTIAERRAKREQLRREKEYWDAVDVWRWWKDMERILWSCARTKPDALMWVIGKRADAENRMEALDFKPDPYGLKEQALRAEYAAFKASRESEYGGRGVSILSYDNWARCRLTDLETPIPYNYYGKGAGT